MKTSHFVIAAAILMMGCKKDDPEPAPSPNSPTQPVQPTDADGNVYGTIQIGAQVWMTENLRTTKFRNGTDILHIPVATEWDDEQVGAWCYYQNDDNNDPAYGRLYNWYAVNDPAGLCPTGWHVPSDEEWKEMELYLGMWEVMVEEWGFRGLGLDIAGKLMKDDGWIAPLAATITNETGFNGLPSGGRLFHGAYVSVGTQAWWWTSSVSGPYEAIMRGLMNESDGVYRIGTQKYTGACIRCIRD